MTHVRTLVHHGTRVFWALMAAALVFTLTSNGAEATHQPADKVAATSNVNDITFAESGQPTLLLKQAFRTSTTSDLLLQVASECSIISNVTTTGNETSSTRGQLRYKLTISTDGGPERPIGVMQTAPSTTTSTSSDDGGVVFCDRKYERQTSFFDDTNATIRTFMETRTANAFNWVQLNAGRGVHTVRLYATYTEANVSQGNSTGVIGRRTMIIEPVKAKNDEQVTDLVVD